MRQLYLSRIIMLVAMLTGWNMVATAQNATFTVTGSVQVYTVPLGVYSISVNAVGAVGGKSSTNERGGYGGLSTGVINVTPGELIYVYVGGAGARGIVGTSQPPGFNDSGAFGGWCTLIPGYGGGGGGGASDIRIGGTSLTNRVLVAGGGGGGACNCSNPGGNGGGLVGQNAPSCSTEYCGKGGTQSAGGLGGTYSVYGTSGNGVLGWGGIASTTPYQTLGSAGGGGGGGYYGGGGGSWGGGGGGSSYADPTLVSSPFLSQGFNTLGDGYIVFHLICTSPVAGTITGTDTVCQANSTTLADITGSAGGVWSSNQPGIATVGSTTGVVTGVSGGTATIDYIVDYGMCGATSTSVTVLVNPSPAPFTGSSNICLGVPDTLSAAISGGTWTTSNGSISSIDPSSGIMNGISVGTDTVNYVLSSGCSAMLSTTVNLVPGVYSVLGGGVYCQGGAGVDISLDNSDGLAEYKLYDNGSFVTSMTGSGTILDFGNQADTGTYTVIASQVIGGCKSNMLGSAAVTTNPVPDAISGIMAVCVNSTTTLTDDTLGGTWSSSNLSLATIGSTGIVSGVLPGTLMVSYTLSTGCMAMTTVTVNALPAVFNVMGGGSYCTGSPSAFDISLDNSSTGFSYQLFKDGIASGLPSSGSGSLLDFGFTSVPGAYTIVSTDNNTSCQSNMADTAFIKANPLPIMDTVTGGGSYCDGGVGQHIGLNNSTSGVKYQLYHRTLALGSALPGFTGRSVDFGYLTDSGYYMVVATDTTTINFCQSNMFDSVRISVNPLPAVHTVTGGGSYCANLNGLHVGLNGSNTGILYQLYYNGSTLTDTLSGSGSAIDFGLYTRQGSYSVIAQNKTTLCTNNMTGSVPVIINPLPAVFNVTGGGSYCYMGSGKDIMLNASVSGFVYQLYDNGATIGSPMSGGSGAIDFGNQTDSGTYTVIAINSSTMCYDTMTGNPHIAINALPTVYTVTGGGSYCANDTGRVVSLDYSDNTINYRLYKDWTPVGSWTTGVGGALSFGNQTLGGTYTAIATNTVTTCSDTMASSVLVVVLSLPLSHNVTGGGSYCAGGTGVTIGLNGSNGGFKYQLWHGTLSIGSPLRGNGSPLNFGLDTAAGVYKVIAQDTNTLCSVKMNDSAIVVINPLLTPAITIATGPDTVCAGTMVTFRATATHGGVVPAYQWKVNGTTSGSDSANFSYVPTNGNRITIELTSSEACVTVDTAVDTVGITVWANGRPSVIIAADNYRVCKGTPVTFTATDSLGGPAPSYQWYTNSLAAGTGSSITYVPSTGDIVYCTLTSDYMCRTADNANSNNVTITVDSPIVPSLVINANPGTYISKGQTDTLTAFVSNGGSSPLFQWYLGSTAIPGATNAVYYKPNFANHDSVTCQVTRTDACHLTGFNGVIINVSVLGIESVNNDMTLVMYPNPNKGAFTIKGSTGNVADETIAVEVTDMVGQSVYKGTLLAKDGAINENITLTNGMANGMYLLTLHSASGNSVVHFTIEQ